jgi:hypothetical protein
LAKPGTSTARGRKERCPGGEAARREGAAEREARIDAARNHRRCLRYCEAVPSQSKRQLQSCTLPGPRSSCPALPSQSRDAYPKPSLNAKATLSENTVDSILSNVCIRWIASVIGTVTVSGLRILQSRAQARLNQNQARRFFPIVLFLFFLGFSFSFFIEG